MSSGSKRVVGVEVDTNYDKEDEDKKPGYAEGPEGTHSTSRDGFEGESSSVQLGRARTVKGTSKDEFSAEAAGPTLSAGQGEKKDAVGTKGVLNYVEGSLGEADSEGVGVMLPMVGGVAESCGEFGTFGTNCDFGGDTVEIGGGCFPQPTIKIGW